MSLIAYYDERAGEFYANTIGAELGDSTTPSCRCSRRAGGSSTRGAARGGTAGRSSTGATT